MVPPSPILWQNADKTVTLIDIPRSISAAQGTDDIPCTDFLRSSQPLQDAYQSNEPKSASAKEKLQANTVDDELHSTYKNLIEKSLSDVKQSHLGEWCHPRPFKENSSVNKDSFSKSKKRKHHGQSPDPKADDDEKLVLGGLVDELPDHFLRTIQYGPDNQNAAIFELNTTDSVIHDDNDDSDKTPAHLEYVKNCSNGPATLTARLLSDYQPFHFRVPPNSTLALANCMNSNPFVEDEQEFDFILLDPPWPNRSVERATQSSKSAYKTESGLTSLHNMLCDTMIETMNIDDGFVGVWITNKSAVRKLVLGDDGLFNHWDLGLVEEWVWVKTTIHGEPVSNLDSMWRKPYEVLLIGRRRNRGGRDQASEGDATPSTNPINVKRRVILGVPDLHSRKPCLKDLLEILVPKEAAVLEVFARNLVAGWSSWGDECIKFNWDGYWKSEQDVNETAQGV